ncbi:MAG: isoaspartyl peptidase/L-asparaginase [Bacteroidetes bacterium]|nr:isoaspartyl peptidase/L-asparaginase [Bacteroidota bacterium]
MKDKFSIAIHGGAGTLTRGLMSEEMEQNYKKDLLRALRCGASLLEKGASSMDAVEAAVRELEDSPLFNAGKGSVFTHEGKHEMDACIMEGNSRKAGAVAGVSGIRNPVSLARLVMEKSDHVLLSSKGALQFARQQGVSIEEDEYFYNELRYLQWQQALKEGTVQLDHTPLNEKKFGTVGAVALDIHGNLAAATSTGGMTNKRFGRIGDSPIPGAGNYANNATCAVSCTGSGEYFIRGVVAYDVSCLIEYKGLTLKQACHEVIQNRVMALGGDGGLIAVSPSGELCLEFNTEGMYRASRDIDGLERVGIYR